MSKYEPLGIYLNQQNRPFIPMTFREIERILGRALPPSKAHRAWWSNNPRNNVMTRQWLEAGYETESVDISSEKLVFRRTSRGNDVAAATSGRPVGGQGDDALSDPIFGCMKGTMTIPVDLDLTLPAAPHWGDVYRHE